MNTRALVAMCLVLLLFGCGKRDVESVGLYDMRSDEMFPTNHKLRALALAASNGDIDKIDQLIASGVDVNAVDTKGYTAAFWVLFNPNKEGFKRLLEHGADPNVILHSSFANKPRDNSLMHAAARQASYIGIEYLEMVLGIGRGDPNLELPSLGSRPIGETVGRKEGALFALLYNHGAEIDYRDKCGYPLIDKAATAENFELVYFLLDQGVDHTSGHKRGIGIHDTIRVLSKHTSIARPRSSQYMWFWRCIDILEKRGMTFDFLPEEDRPTKLDTNPPAILSLINKR